MKMRSPLNSTLAVPMIGNAGSASAPAETKKIPGKFLNAIKRSSSVTLTLLTGFLSLTAWSIGGRAVAADDFELAMVIKETTNPYYNATLSGARDRKSVV